MNVLQSGSYAQTRDRKEPRLAHTVHLSPAATPDWLPSADGAVSSTGRAKDF
jgi:hypothetical protein